MAGKAQFTCSAHIMKVISFLFVRHLMAECYDLSSEHCDPRAATSKQLGQVYQSKTLVSSVFDLERHVNY